MTTKLLTLIFSVALTLSASATPSAETILAKFLDGDPWGISGAEMRARATLKDKRGATRELSLVAHSRRHDPPFSKSIVRFTAPADLAGAGFLQIQNRDADDDRFLFLPELKRSRRISGNLRGSSFMGTDFSFADFDRRDLRESTTTKQPDEKLGPYPCFHLQTVPKRSDSPYSRIELWIRKDNHLPLKMQMFDHSKALFKTFTAQEMRRVSGHWYVTRSRMVNHQNSHETELVLESVKPVTEISDDEFTLRSLEKL